MYRNYGVIIDEVGLLKNEKMKLENAREFADEINEIMDKGLKETLRAQEMAKNIQELLPPIQESLQKTKRDLIDEIQNDDRFEILADETPTFRSLFGGLYETKYTKLLKWLLTKNKDSFHVVFSALFPKGKVPPKIDAYFQENPERPNVTAEVTEESGQVDLKITSEGNHFIVFVEVKTGSDESNDQLHRYAKDLKRLDFDCKHLICLCQKDTIFTTEDIIKKEFSEITYHRQTWLDFVKEVKEVRSCPSIDLSEETNLLLQILIRDRIFAEADLDPEDENLQRLVRTDNVDEIDLSLSSLQNLRDSINSISD